MAGYCAPKHRLPARERGREHERGASLSEYALILSLFVMATAAAIGLIEDESGSFLVDSGSRIGEPPPLAADYGLADPVTPPWLTQPPPPTTTTTTTTTTTSTTSASATYGPNLIGNGGFESPAISKNWTVRKAPPWSSTNGKGVEIWVSGFLGVPAYDGSQLAELNVAGVTTYSQSVTVTPGKTYRWAFAHRGRDGSERLLVLVDGAEVQTATSPVGSWTTYEGTFTASSGTATFALRSVTGGGRGNLIDGVVVQEQLTP